MRLTADLCARAIVSAARVYGDDPRRAVLVERGVLRRALAPACLAISVCTNEDLRVCASVLKINHHSLVQARKHAPKRFWEAHDAAIEAIRRPDLQRVSEARRRAAPVAPPASAPKPMRKKSAPSARLASTPISGGPAMSDLTAALPANQRRRAPAAPPIAPRSAVSASDRALIDAAISNGAVKQMPAAVPAGVEVLGLKLQDQPEPLAYNRDIHLYSRVAPDRSKRKGW